MKTIWRAMLLISMPAMILSGVLTSCKKTSPAEALITIKDTLGKAVSGAKVVLRQDSVINQTTGVQANIYDEKVTDLNGQSHHEFKWEAVLNVEVSKGSVSEHDYIRLEQSKTVEKTIILK